VSRLVGVPDDHGDAGQAVCLRMPGVETAAGLQPGRDLVQLLVGEADVQVRRDHQRVRVRCSTCAEPAT
jgi:hypothetical protein